MFLCSLESSSRNKNVVEKIFENFLNFFAFFDQNVILAPTQKSQIRRQNFFPKSGLNCTLVPLDYGNISFWMSQEGKKLRKIGKIKFFIFFGFFSSHYFPFLALPLGPKVTNPSKESCLSQRVIILCYLDP